METPGVGFPIPPLISSCQKIVRTLHDVAKKFKRAPLMMTSIASECGLIHVALTQLRDFDWGNLNPDNKNQLEQMIRTTETIILGCTLTLSVIEEYALELQEYVQGSKLSPTEQMGVMSRVRVFWKEDEMRELLVQLRGYQSGLTDLLRAANDDVVAEDQDMSHVLNNFVSLLNRSRNSRSKKPLSIRSAMQQSVAYTTLARSTTVASPTISQHVIPPRKSSGTIAVPPLPVTRSIEGELVRGMTPMTADLYDGATSATASRRAVAAERSRKKRPVFLALHNDDTDTHSEQARYVQSRKDREHLRRSSPTVGENFTFLETTSDAGEKPMPESSRHTRNSSLSKGNSGRSGHSRQHSRSAAHEEVEHTFDQLEDGQDTEDDDLEEDLDGPPPPPSQSLTPGVEKLDAIREESHPQPKPKKSTSSVRSQIIGLPEQARLRKQASGEMARQQRTKEETPLIPAIKMYHTPNRVSSQEALKRRRQSDMTHKHQASDPTNLAYRPRKTPSRSASQDARATLDYRSHPAGPLPATPYDQQYGDEAQAPISSRLDEDHSSTPGRAMCLTPQPGVHAVENDSWPFTAEMAQQNHQAYLNSPSTVHSRNASEARSYSSLRAASPDSMPRASRSATPLINVVGQAYTPRRGRSRSNTGPTLTEDIEPLHIDDSSSLSHSVAPSTLSSQWYRSPQERLGLGSKVLRANAPPNWEQMSREESFEEAQAQHNGTHGSSNDIKLFSIYPPKDEPSTTQHGASSYPPRSPLLTDKFLSDVGGLPQDRQPDPPSRALSLKSLAPRRMLSSRQGKREEVEDPPTPVKKKKTDSRFPSFGELVSEYKSLASKWHTSSENVDELPERPSTSATNLRTQPINEEGPYTLKNATNPSLRTKPSREAESFDSSQSSKGKGAKNPAKSVKSEKKKRKPSLFSEMRSEYKSLSNNWYQEAVAEDAHNQRLAAAPANGSLSNSG